MCWNLFFNSHASTFTFFSTLVEDVSDARYLTALASPSLTATRTSASRSAEVKAGEELEIRGGVDTWGAQENFGGFLGKVERGQSVFGRRTPWIEEVTATTPGAIAFFTNPVMASTDFFGRYGSCASLSASMPTPLKKTTCGESGTHNFNTRNPLNLLRPTERSIRITIDLRNIRDPVGKAASSIHVGASF